MIPIKDWWAWWVCSHPRSVRPVTCLVAGMFSVEKLKSLVGATTVPAFLIARPFLVFPVFNVNCQVFGCFCFVFTLVKTVTQFFLCLCKCKSQASNHTRDSVHIVLNLWGRWIIVSEGYCWGYSFFGSADVFQVFWNVWNLLECLRILFGNQLSAVFEVSYF